MLLDWSRRKLRISAATLVSCWSRVAMAGDYAMRGKGTIVRRRKAVENSPAQHRFAWSRITGDVEASTNFGGYPV